MKADLTLMQATLATALEDLHTRIAEAVLALDARALDWRPAPGISSVHELIVRVAAEEWRWIAVCVVAGMAVSATAPSDCDRAASSTLPLSDHPLHDLGNAGQISQTVLAALAPTAWTELREMDGGQVTVAGCVLHVLEELARTLGQIEVVAQWWGAGTEARGAKGVKRKM